MSDSEPAPEVRTDKEKMREYNNAPDDALEGVPEQHHVAVHYAFRCGRSAARRLSTPSPRESRECKNCGGWPLQTRCPANHHNTCVLVSPPNESLPSDHWPSELKDRVEALLASPRGPAHVTRWSKLAVEAAHWRINGKPVGDVILNLMADIEKEVPVSPRDESGAVPGDPPDVTYYRNQATLDAIARVLGDPDAACEDRLMIVRHPKELSDG